MERDGAGALRPEAVPPSTSGSEPLSRESGSVTGAEPRAGESPARRSFLGRSRFLAPALLVGAVFLSAWFSHRRGELHRPREQDELTVNALALASNLSAEHRFLGFFYRFVDGDGEVRYAPHNRFPPGMLFLIRAAIAPFPDDPTAQIHAARALMFVFFAGIALLSYLSLSRLTGRRWIAFTATLLALSSYYWHLVDLVGTEVAPDLFVVLVVFHGMVLFVQEGRFRQLLVKTAAAPLFGWHVFALLTPFLVFGWALAWKRAGRPPGTEGESAGRGRSSGGEWRRRAFAVLRSRHSRLGAAAFVVGLVVLGWNFGTEYAAFEGEVAFRDLSSVSSLVRRTGQDEAVRERYAETVDWSPYLLGQLHRVGRMAAPFAIPADFGPRPDRDSELVETRGILLAPVVLGAALVGLRLLRHRALFATLALFGFCWSLPLRYTVAFHEHETLYYLGLTLVFYTVLLTALSRLLGARFVGAAPAFAFLVFAVSHYRIADYGYDPEEAAYWRRVEADFSVIRPLTEGAKVFYPEWRWRHNELPLGGFQIVPYFLSGRVLVIRDDRRTDGDFALRLRRRPGPALLTPDNREVFLYHRDAIEGDLFRGLEEAVPRIRARFEVHLRNRWLLYVREPCAEEDREARFFARFVPGDSADSPAGPGARGSEELVFDFSEHAFSSGERCVAGVRLPAYDLARIETGEFARPGGAGASDLRELGPELGREDGAPVLWRGEIVLSDAAGGR